MDMNHKRKFFDRHAKNWDRKNHLGDPMKLRELVSTFKIKKGAKVLDIGCGTGVLLSHLSKNVGEDGKLFALDFSLKMLKMAKQKNIAKNITYINADARDLPLADSSFDYITCFATFPHLDKKQKSLKEMRRVLKTKGKVFISHFGSREEINAFHKRSSKAISGDILPTKKNMKKMMEKAAFENINIIDQSSLYLAYGEKK
jgi:ubiquinone/menaquinone biosynthesis C-methylase UbiE